MCAYKKENTLCITKSWACKFFRLGLYFSFFFRKFTPAILDFHNLDIRHAWHTYKNRGIPPHGFYVLSQKNHSTPRIVSMTLFLQMLDAEKRIITKVTTNTPVTQAIIVSQGITKGKAKRMFPSMPMRTD